jgi:hypothetical protein
MATMIITRTRALLTATTAPIGSPKVFSSAPAHGTAGIMAARVSGETSMTANAATLDAVTSGAIMGAEVTRGKDSAGGMVFVGATLATAGTAAETHEAAGVLTKVTSAAKADSRAAATVAASRVAAIAAATPTAVAREAEDVGKFRL